MLWAQISRARGLSRAASGLGVEMWAMVTLGNSSASHALRSSPAIGSSGREQRNRVTVLHERAATSMRKQCPVCGGWKRPMIMPWLCCAMGFVLYYTWKGEVYVIDAGCWSRTMVALFAIGVPRLEKKLLHDIIRSGDLWYYKKRWQILCTCTFTRTIVFLIGSQRLSRLSGLWRVRTW